MTSQDDIRTNIQSFRDDAPLCEDRARSILALTTYWVLDEDSGFFGPGKFVGYRQMDFNRYEKALANELVGDPFDGGTSREAIENVTRRLFRPMPALNKRLKDWAVGLNMSGVFDSVDESKWRYILLKSGKSKDGVTLPTKRGEEEGLADAIEEAWARARGQGFMVNKEVRKAVERHAMEAAKGCLIRDWEKVEDRHKNHPYDYWCSGVGGVLYAEVKGTTTEGKEVLLTPREVSFARKHKAEMALVIVHSISVSIEGDKVAVSGGEVHLIQPWDIDRGTLKATGFVHALEGVKVTH